ncbi:hypothetical protein C0989_008583 [Termitomyces sp. Mn162]|nr:hypothetical protein C0989_008583 [Termitomyces sp. Mn162]
MTPGPLHYAVDALPATSPPSPSPAATLEADPWASRTWCSRTQPGPKHNPFSNRQRSGNNAYEGSPHAPKQPRWPANPPSALLPPTLPVADKPPAPFPTPPPPLWAAPPAASDTPASPVPLTLAPVPPALRCSTPAPTPPSLPVPRLNPPSPVEALHFLRSATEDTPSLRPPRGGPTCPADHPELASPNV